MLMKMFKKPHYYKRNTTVRLYWLKNFELLQITIFQEHITSKNLQKKKKKKPKITYFFFRQYFIIIFSQYFTITLSEISSIKILNHYIIHPELIL